MNKVAVITGGAGGIGFALAANLVEKNVDIALVDIIEDALIEAKESLIKLRTNANISIHKTDVTDVNAMQQLVDDVLERHQRVDFLFNNAGITITRSFKEHSIEHWQKIIDLNLWSVIYGCKFFLAEIEKTQGSIINTSSLAGFLGIPYQAGYSLTKNAVRSISETLYAEVKSSGVHVLSVHPGAIRTNIIKKAIVDSDNPELTQKLADITDKTAVSPEKLASKVIAAVDKRKQRVIVGADAYAVEIAKRLMPSMIHKLFAALFGYF